MRIKIGLKKNLPKPSGFQTIITLAPTLIFLGMVFGETISSFIPIKKNWIYKLKLTYRMFTHWLRFILWRISDKVPFYIHFENRVV